jgi:hypothetical protein
MEDEVETLFRLQTSRGTVHLHEDKEQAVTEHFKLALGNQENRSETLNWDILNIPRHDLHFLEEEFTEEEIKEVIFDLKPEAAPGPDGFISKFFKCCREIIKEDLKLAVRFFYNQHNQHFNLLNSAHIYCSKALFRCTPNSNFLHSLSITSILGHMHGAVNVCKKITNCTV